MKKYIIAAVADDMAIGRDNELLWHISADMKYFRKTTMGAPVIMGYKTWLSIGRPLPGRRNIVISHAPFEAPESFRSRSPADTSPRRFFFVRVNAGVLFRHRWSKNL